MDQSTLDAPEKRQSPEEQTNQSQADIPTEALSDDSLAMVRNILFGEQVRENKANLSSLERFVKTSFTTLQEDMQQQVDTLHQRIQTQQDETQNRIDQETQDMRQSMQQQRKELLGRIKEIQEQLHTNKVDRHALSSLLSNVAKELADEPA